MASRDTAWLVVRGKPSEDKAFFAVVFRKTFLDNSYGNSIGYELAVVHILFGFKTERSLFFYSCPEHIACRNLGNTIFVNQSFSLGTFTGARSPLKEYTLKLPPYYFINP